MMMLVMKKRHSWRVASTAVVGRRAASPVPMDERCLRAARYVELAKDKAARTQNFARATELKEAEDALREFAVRDGKLKATLKSSVCAADFGAAAQVQRDLDQLRALFAEVAAAGTDGDAIGDLVLTTVNAPPDPNARKTKFYMPTLQDWAAVRTRGRRGGVAR
jgi:hypothetical protein